eukprot:10897797-Prorocentrum_lima.AAC.1
MPGTHAAEHDARLLGRTAITLTDSTLQTLRQLASDQARAHTAGPTDVEMGEPNSHGDEPPHARAGAGTPI